MHPHSTSVRQRPARGFSYVGVMVAIAIVGISVVALIQSLTAATQANAAARESAVAVNLARNIHEYAMTLNPSAIDALNGQTFGTGTTFPIGADGAALQGYANWSQNVEVTRVIVDATHDIENNATTTTTSRLRRLVVHARYNGQNVYSETWIIAPTGF